MHEKTVSGVTDPALLGTHFKYADNVAAAFLEETIPTARASGPRIPSFSEHLAVLAALSPDQFIGDSLNPLRTPFLS